MTGLRHLYITASTVLLACSGSGPTAVSYESGNQGIQAGYLAASASSAGVKLNNQTERPVFTFLVERNEAALVDWAPCTFFGNCGNGLAPGATTTIPWDKVVGYKPEAKEYLVYWYHVETINGKATFTGMQSLVVTR